MSCQPCGCDPEADHMCERHRDTFYGSWTPEQARAATMEDHGRQLDQDYSRPGPKVPPTRDQVERGAQQKVGADTFMAADAPYVHAHNQKGTGAAERYTAAPIGSIAGQADITKNPEGVKLTTIKDSGERVRFASGSLRDPSTGKLDWTRITWGPMMRRWAQHLTTAEAKYPDPKPDGVPNFMLIETEEELVRYRKSAFRHFMSWFFGETDEDHAAATFFNMNGVEIIKEKRQRQTESEHVRKAIEAAEEITGASFRRDR